MSFYTSLTGLNAATAMLGVTANNISNVGTTGFKRSRADFGDIFATSPLQKASSTVGQGVALKQVSQEFSQGNISFSSNALDLAITGDGFFPLRSADGLTDTYTRNGSFSLNEQFNVVNSAGQRLMAATVDSTGSANVNDRVVLTIPQKTSGEAKQTSQVSLGLNFPADATVITKSFSRTDPSTYNKSSAFTVYDNGGNGYLATIYYVKSSNASQNVPFNKWQTYVFVGEDQVPAALAQSTDINGQLQYVNQYGEIKPYSEVKDELTTAKTQLISLNELTDKRTSASASLTGVGSTVDLSGSSLKFSDLKSLPTPVSLTNLFKLKVDGSTDPVTVDLSYLANSNTILTGATLAAEATKYINKKFGNETTFNFTSTAAGTNPDTLLTLTDSRIQNGAPSKVPLVLQGFQDPSNVPVEELTAVLQTQVDNSVLGGHARQQLTFTGTATGPTSFLGVPITYTPPTLPGGSVAGTPVVSANGDLPATTATKLVAMWNNVDATGATPGKTALQAAVLGLENIEQSTTDPTSVIVTYFQYPKSSVAISLPAGGTASTGKTDFLGVTIPNSEAGQTAVQVAASIVKNKATLLAGTAAVAAGIRDIQFDPSNSSKIILVYNQSKAVAATGAPPALAASSSGGISFAAATTVNVINPGLISDGTTPNTIAAVTTAVAGVQTTISSLLTPGLASSPMKVAYDYNSQSFQITDSTNSGANTLTMQSGSGLSTDVANTILNLNPLPVTLDSSGLTGLKMLPNNKNPIRALTDQRYGIKVSYDPVSKSFTVSSGTTGDNSSIEISNVSSQGASALFGFKADKVSTSTVATRGISSEPAVAVGKPPTVNVSNNFAVDSTNNSFIVTVDGVKGTVVIPPSPTYSLESFMRELQKGINNLASKGANDDSQTTVSGVKVTFDYTNNRFVFKTGTQGSDSFIKISGSSNWGLDQVEAGRGTTSTWIKPSQHKDLVGGALQPKYIDKDGKETTNGDGFTGLPAWSPIYLDKGELTFNTAGKLYSPLKGTQLETVYLAGGKGALTINVNYAASTQYTSPFAVLSQSQDGAPEGSLVGVTIGNDGLVSASFSNGTQKSLAKILLTNFSSPSGLRQIGDSSFLASAASGKPILGTAGSAGFGTLRAGATERANVDLTQELVDLITAQRNFQANAKAIETSSTMTSAIINLRS